RRGCAAWSTAPEADWEDVAWVWLTVSALGRVPGVAARAGKGVSGGRRKPNPRPKRFAPKHLRRYSGRLRPRGACNCNSGGVSWGWAGKENETTAHFHRSIAPSYMAYLTHTVFGSVKNRNASSPPSRPTPLCFMPPKGVRRSRSSQQFTQTVPDS